METGPRSKVSSERPEKRGIDLATPGLVVLICRRKVHNVIENTLPIISV